MNPSIIVYGPQGCGKTTNAQLLMGALGLSKHLDEPELRYAHSKLPAHDTLVLTNDASLPSRFPDIPCMTYEDAMQIVRGHRNS